MCVGNAGIQEDPTSLIVGYHLLGRLTIPYLDIWSRYVNGLHDALLLPSEHLALLSIEVVQNVLDRAVFDITVRLNFMEALLVNNRLVQHIDTGLIAVSPVWDFRSAALALLFLRTYVLVQYI